MTQEQANKIFETDLGQQLDVIYVTSDDAIFIRHWEAVQHKHSKDLKDQTITEFYPED
jgi:hypothetical protein